MPFAEDDRAIYSDFLGLARIMQREERIQGGLLENPTSEDIHDFWEEQKTIGPGIVTSKRRGAKSAIDKIAETNSAKLQRAGQDSANDADAGYEILTE